MTKWYENSSEVAFKIYGPIFDEILPNFLQLDDYYNVDPDEIIYTCEIDIDTELYLEEIGQNKHQFKSSLGYLEYEARFQILRTNIFYNLTAFLFFKDEISTIIKDGEKKPLSLYVYYISAIKNLGDSIDFFKKLETLMINSRDRLRNLKKHNVILDRIFTEYLEYSKQCRNNLCHRHFAQFDKNGSVPVYTLDVLKNRELTSMEYHALTIMADKKPADEFLNGLFESVAQGIELKAKYLIEECFLHKPE